MNNKHLVSILVALVLTMGVAVFSNWKANTVHGSVSVSSEYNATTTGAASSLNSASNLIYTGSGSIGSIIFTTPTTAIIEVWNATTSNVNLRTGNLASSSILIAHFPSGTGTSTVPIDSAFTTGLLITTKATTMSSTTVTYRRE